jgi:hypothetical protein
MPRTEAIEACTSATIGHPACLSTTMSPPFHRGEHMSLRTLSGIVENQASASWRTGASVHCTERPRTLRHCTGTSSRALMVPDPACRARPGSRCVGHTDALSVSLRQTPPRPCWPPVWVTRTVSLSPLPSLSSCRRGHRFMTLAWTRGTWAHNTLAMPLPPSPRHRPCPLRRQVCMLGRS